MRSFYTLHSRRGLLYGLRFAILVSWHQKSFRAPSNLNQCLLSRDHSQPERQQKGVAWNEPRIHSSYMQESIKTFENFLSFRGYDWKPQRDGNSLCPSCKTPLPTVSKINKILTLWSAVTCSFQQLQANEPVSARAVIMRSGKSRSSAN